MELPPLNESSADERQAMMRRWLRPAAIAVALALVAFVAFRSLRGRADSAAAPAPVSRSLGFRREARAPEGVRIRVEVINATKTRGLARRATQHLRDRGFDVVDVGTTSEQLDTTLVLDRSGHPEWAKLVADALGGGARAVARPDSSRYLDVTVQLGASWRPPSKPFYP